MRYGKVIDFKCAAAPRAVRRTPRRTLQPRARAPPPARAAASRAAPRARRMSELRVIELLEGLCERVKDFALWTPSAAWADANPTEEAEAVWINTRTHVQGMQGARARARARAALRRGLARVRAAGVAGCEHAVMWRTHGRGARADETLKGAKGSVMQKEIAAYCARVIEQHEEAVRARRSAARTRAAPRAALTARARARRAADGGGAARRLQRQRHARAAVRAAHARMQGAAGARPGALLHLRSGCAADTRRPARGARRSDASGARPSPRTR